MTQESWVTIKTIQCTQLKKEVSLEFLMSYPPEHLPDQARRLVARRCSAGSECVVRDDCHCHWTGTNPLYDPFEYYL